MKCPRCDNKDRTKFGYLNGRAYCRNCISFGRIFIDEDLKSKSNLYSSVTDYHLDYSLTKLQLEISNQVLYNYKHQLSSMIKAVCGAGKTEIVYEVMKYALNNNQRVCFTTPRKELTKELHQRINSQFSNIDISLVYGGYTKNLDGQLVICTTHQLFRYHQAFDLLILDEMDAFPYNGDPLLNSILMKSIKGNYVFMSATMDQKEEILLLTKRYHNHPLPVPKVLVMPNLFMVIFIIYKINKYLSQNKLVLLFVATINQGTNLYKFLKPFFKIGVVHSKIKDMSNLLLDYNSHKLNVLITSTILERGVTFNNVQVIVYNADHVVFNRNTLIQIAGRVGRKVDNPSGDVYFLTKQVTREIKSCIKSINQDNA